MRKTDAFRRAAALLAALSITVSLAAPAFAETYYYIDDGDITITKDENGQTVKQGNKEAENIGADEEIIITTHKEATTTLESDLEGPAAEDSGFGPVVEDNYQPAQPEDAEESKDADQPENTDRQESAEQSENTDRQESAGQQAQPQPQQAAPAAAPAAPTSVNGKGNGFWGNTITVINNAATALKLTLKDVKIDVSDTGKEDYFGSKAGKAALSIQGSGDVEIELDGKNELKSGVYKAGLEKNTSTGKLTLKDDNKEAGSGSLKANGGARSAGIGGSKDNGTNNITINGGTVEANGGLFGAGIGGGDSGSGENITINSGTVTAAGGSYGAGIGGGYLGDHNSGNGGKDITINGGRVTATGGYWSAGIGGGGIGMYGGCTNGENITINGGTVTATGGDCGAGIGGGSGSSGGGGINGSGENITINGGTVTATGGKNGAGIGGGYEGSGGKNITIKGGSVTAFGGEWAAGIGGGNGGSGNNITINGGTVNAAGTDGAGIGGGLEGSGNNITITGGTVTATSKEAGAGIGGGYKGYGKNITITGGTVTAKGSILSAGIGGGGEGGNGEDITITGGTVNASGWAGAGIGGGVNASGSNVTVSGAAQVTVTASKGSAWNSADTGATIGNGGSVTEDGDLVNGKEIQADISGLTTGYIHHIIYNLDGSLKREWWEPERPQPNPEDPNAPAEESNEVSLGTPGLHVETLEGDLLPFDAQQQGSTLTVTANTLAARLHGTRQALEALREQGVEQIQFVTTLKTTTLSVEDLLAEGGSWFALEHDGLVSRRLSAAQAESLKCRMR